MKFGIFLAPFHRIGENPTLAMKRDMRLIEHLDDLGYDEAWIGEHHSYARELIADPAVFIAAAAMRTRGIRLGTGVVSNTEFNYLNNVTSSIQTQFALKGATIEHTWWCPSYGDARRDSRKARRSR